MYYWISRTAGLFFVIRTDTKVFVDRNIEEYLAKNGDWVSYFRRPRNFLTAKKKREGIQRLKNKEGKGVLYSNY